MVARSWLLASLVVLALALHATGAGAVEAEPARALRGVRVTTAPVIDGHLDEAAWRDAEAATGFTQKMPQSGAPPSDATIAKVLYDDDALYVGIECPQASAPISLRLTRRDRNVESDWVSVSLDTRSDGKSALEFLINASGVLVDGARSNDVEYSADWDDNWEGKTWVRDNAWSAELRIPLRVLRFPRADVQSWGLQVRRYISGKQETDEWSYIPRTTAAEVSRYGRLEGLRGLSPKSAVELRPFVVLRLRSRQATADTAGSGVDFTPSAGLDAKWHPSQDLTLDATLNPDFSQVEADQVVLNLSTFEVYKPEKRPFFLEGADLVAPKLGLQLVYTKRIGRAPDQPQLRSSSPFAEKLVDLPEPSPIYGATKLTGRLGPRLSIGTLSAVTGRNDARVELAGGGREGRLLEPLTAYNVLRLKQDLGNNAHVGLLLTGVTRAESVGDYTQAPSGTAPEAPAQTLCPNQSRADGSRAPFRVTRGARCFHDAYVGGIDARLRAGDWVTSGQVVASMIQRGPARQLVDGTVINPGDVAPASDLYFGKEGGKLLTWTWFGNAGKKVDFDDLGFMWRQNVVYGGTGAEYRTVDAWWHTLETHTGFEVVGVNNVDGLQLAREASIYEEWKLTSFWTARVAGGARAQRFDDREVGDGTALERDAIGYARVRVQTDPRARVAATLSSSTSFVRQGARDRSGSAFATNGDLTVVVRALPQFDVELTPQLSRAHGEPRYATDADDGTHLFAPLDANNLSMTIRAIYTFTPRLSLQAYTQGFLANGHYGALMAAPRGSGRLGQGSIVRISDLSPYTGGVSGNPDFQQGAVNVNAQLRWEYLLGSTLALVYARSQYPSVLLDPGENGVLATRSIGRSSAVDQIYIRASFFWG